MQVLKHVGQRYPDLEVVVITGVGDVELAVEAMKLGAYDYLCKPVEADRLVTCVDRALERSRMRDELRRLREQVSAAGAAGEGGLQGLRHAGREHAADPRQGGADRAQREQRAHLGRERDGQGARRPRHPPDRLPGGQALHRGERARVRLRAVRLPVLRPRARRVHRGRQREAGPVRGGRRRDALPRRDRRHRAAGAVEAPARPAERRVLPARLDEEARGRRADHRRHQQGPGPGDRGGALPARPLLPAQHQLRLPAARSASGRATSSCSRTPSSTSTPRERQGDPLHLGRRDGAPRGVRLPGQRAGAREHRRGRGGPRDAPTPSACRRCRPTCARRRRRTSPGSLARCSGRSRTSRRSTSARSSSTPAATARRRRGSSASRASGSSPS